MLYGVFGGSTSDINVAKEGSFHGLVVPYGIPGTVAGNMDVNQDGIADIAIGCPGDIYGRYVYVIYGKRQSSTWHAMDVTAMGRSGYGNGICRQEIFGNQLEIFKSMEVSHISETEFMNMKLNAIQIEYDQLILQYDDLASNHQSLRESIESNASSKLNTESVQVDYDNMKSSLMQKLGELEEANRTLSNELQVINFALLVNEESKEQGLIAHQKKVEQLLCSLDSKDKEISTLSNTNAQLIETKENFHRQQNQAFAQESNMLNENEGLIKKIQQFETREGLLVSEKEVLQNKVMQLQRSIEEVSNRYELQELKLIEDIHQKSTLIESLQKDSNNVSSLWTRIQFLEASAADRKALYKTLSDKYNLCLNDLKSKETELENIQEKVADMENKVVTNLNAVICRAIGGQQRQYSSLECSLI